MYQTRRLTRDSLVKNQTVLLSRTENIRRSQNCPALNQKKTREFCHMNLRRRIQENDSQEIKQIIPDVSFKENSNKRKANNVKKPEHIAQVINKENISQKHKTSTLNKKQKLSLITPNKEYVKRCVNGSVSKSCPIWRCKPNDQVPLLQEIKKRKIDVYDIAEDDELKNELSNKIKKKQRKCNPNVIKQKKKLCKTSKLKGNVLGTKGNCPLSTITKNMSEKNLLVNDKISNVHRNLLKEQNISYLNSKNQVPGCVNYSKKQSEAHSSDQINSITDPLSCKTQEMHNLPKNIQKSGTLLNKKNVYINDDSNNYPDLLKQVLNERTPTKELDSAPEKLKNSPNLCTLNDLNKPDTFSLVPKMTSTPESDSHPCIAPIPALHLKSINARMSEIPAIPGQCVDVVEIASAEELLNIEEQPSVTSVEVSLFESPPKLECDKQMSSSEFLPKRLQINLDYEDCSQPSFKITGNELEMLFPDEQNLEHSIAHNNSNMNEDNILLFDTPLKLKRQKIVSKDKANGTDLLDVKLNKSRKSYDNREKNKKLILKGARKAVKKKTAAMKKEEKLIQSLNEHFSELENFELCLE